MKKTVLRLFVWSLTIVWMLRIGLYSAQNATASTNESNGFTAFVLSIFSDFEEKSLAEQGLILTNVRTLVRKAAHVFVYTVLGFLLAMSLCLLRCHTFWSVPAGILYAVTDEIHQYFVPGRAMMWQDVLVDTGGILLGFGVAFFLLLYVGHKKEKQKKATAE